MKRWEAIRDGPAVLGRIVRPEQQRQRTTLFADSERREKPAGARKGDWK